MLTDFSDATLNLRGLIADLSINLDIFLYIFFFFFWYKCSAPSLSHISSHIHTQLQSVLFVAFDLSLVHLAVYQHTQDLLNNLKRHTVAFHWLSDHICAVSSKHAEAECNCKTQWTHKVSL